ncbi:hypothetical protein [Nocardia wallacei]|uniref:hypothetical protein n=1 Tax=Nocardia wallacei TaxID=480035 RepID=UPI002457FFE2|nr:hypothetical protein [Nocardia wallacei]
MPTQEQIARRAAAAARDAALVVQRTRSAVIDSGKSVEQLQSATGIGAARLAALIDGRRWPNVAEVLSLAIAIGREPSEFFQAEDTESAPRVDAEVAL